MYFKFILGVFLLVILTCGCKENALPIPSDDNWIGLWENEQDAIEIKENGSAKWTTNERWKDRDKIGAWGLWRIKLMIIDGFFLIEDNKLKIGIFKGDKRKKIFSIDEYPTEEIDDNGEFFEYIILDGNTLIKTY